MNPAWKLVDAIVLLYDTSTKEWTADDVIQSRDELSGKKYLP